MCTVDAEIREKLQDDRYIRVGKGMDGGIEETRGKASRRQGSV